MRNYLAFSLLSALLIPSAFAQDSSSVFPGRRIGGATRGPCPQYLLANFVPSTNSIHLSESDRLLIYFSSKAKSSSSIQVTLRGSTSTTTHAFAPTSQQGFLSIDLSHLSPGSYVIESSTVCSNQPSNNVSLSVPAVSELLISNRPSHLSTTAYTRFSRLLRSKCHQDHTPTSLNKLATPPIDLLSLLSINESVRIYCLDK